MVKHWVPSTPWALLDSNHRGGREDSCSRTGRGQCGRPRVQTCGGRVRRGHRLVHWRAALQEKPAERRRERKYIYSTSRKVKSGVVCLLQSNVIYFMRWTEMPFIYVCVYNMILKMLVAINPVHNFKKNVFNFKLIEIQSQIFTDPEKLFSNSWWRLVEFLSIKLVINNKQIINNTLIFNVIEKHSTTQHFRGF